MTVEEFEMQLALGSLPEEYRNNLCRYKTPKISKGHRTCGLCGIKCIHPGDEFYEIILGGYQGHADYINVCKSCSWMSLQTIQRIVDDYNNSKKGTK